MDSVESALRDRYRETWNGGEAAFLARERSRELERLEDREPEKTRWEIELMYGLATSQPSFI